MTHQPAIPEPVDFRTTPPTIQPTAAGWQAWWEDHDMWDGFLLYADLDTAKQHAAVDYIGEEYGWVPGDDPADEAPEAKLTWVFEHRRWHLLDGDKATGVCLYETATYAPTPVSVPADGQRRALRDRIAEVLYERERSPRDPAWADAFAMDRETFEPMADAVMALADAEQAATRAAVLRKAADDLEAWEPEPSERWTEPERNRYEDGVDAAADRLRRMADEEQPAAEARTPRVGEKWRSKHVDRIATVTRVWEHELEPGRIGVAYEWRDENLPGLCGSACVLEMFHELYEPTAVARQDGAAS